MSKPSPTQIEDEAIHYGERIARTKFSVATNYVTCYLAGYADALEELNKLGFEMLRDGLREKLRRRARA